MKESRNKKITPQSPLLLIYELLQLWGKAQEQKEERDWRLR